MSAYIMPGSVDSEGVCLYVNLSVCLSINLSIYLALREGESIQEGQLDQKYEM